MKTNKRAFLMTTAACVFSLSLTGCGFSPRFNTSEDIIDSHKQQEHAESEAESESLAEFIAESESASEAEALESEKRERELEEERREAFRKGLADELTRLRAEQGQDFLFPQTTVPVQSAIHTFNDFYMLPYYYIPAPEVEPVRSLESLKEKLTQMTDSYSGTWSVYLKDLTNDESIVINDSSMPSASVMKLFVLGTVYQAFSDGTLERTSETVSLMSGMITASSNEDTNRLLSLLGNGSYADGIAKVNEYIQANGYSSKTHEYNGFQNEATIVDPKHKNMVSAKDVGTLLENVYRRSFGTREVCNEVENWMLSQETRYKIPAGLPSGVGVGNKTGETDDTENDAAVVYSGSGDYVLVVLSGEWDSKNAAQTHIKEISTAVYDYMCGDADASMVLHFPVNPLAQETEANK